MTVEEVRERVAKIELMKDDDERAHALEDYLHLDVLTAIAKRIGDPAALALEALKTMDIKFSRWCA